MSGRRRSHIERDMFRRIGGSDPIGPIRGILNGLLFSAGVFVFVAFVWSALT